MNSTIDSSKEIQSKAANYNEKQQFPNMETEPLLQNGQLPNMENETQRESSKPSSNRDHKQFDSCSSWLIVLASFINTCIIGAHFGCFSLLYPAITSSFQSQYGISGWIGSVSQAMVYLPSFLYSSAVNKYGCRITTVIGSVIASVGYIISSFCTSIPQLYVTYGIISGTGIGIMFLPSIVIVQQTFTTKRALAAGLSLSGLAIGVITMAPLMQYLIDTFSWRGAMFIFGAVCLNGIANGLLFKNDQKLTTSKNVMNKNDSKIDDASKHILHNCHEELEQEQHYSTFKSSSNSPVLNKIQDGNSISSRPTETSKKNVFFDFVDFSIFKEINFILFGIGTFCMNVGMNTFAMHTPSRALTYGIAPQMVGILPTIMGLGNISARILFSFVSNLSCTNRTLQYGAGILMAGAIIMCSTVAETFPVIALCCVLTGFCFGTSLTVQPTVLVDLFAIERIAKSQATLNIFIGFAALLTTPFAGFLYDTTKNYNIPFLINGGIEVIGSCLIMAVLCLRRRTT